MNEWCVIINDKEGSDRAPYRTEHIGNIPVQVDAGKLVCAGAIYREKNGQSVLAGSHLQIRAETEQEAIDFVKADVFAREGVWDMNSLIIYRLGCVVRKELVK